MSLKKNFQDVSRHIYNCKYVLYIYFSLEIILDTIRIFTAY